MEVFHGIPGRQVYSYRQPLSRLLDAKTRRGLSPIRFPREPPLTLIATCRHWPLRCTRRNNVKSGTPAVAPEARSVAVCCSPATGDDEPDAGGRGDVVT
jgi:hypothetical protein